MLHAHALPCAAWGAPTNPPSNVNCCSFLLVGLYIDKEGQLVTMMAGKGLNVWLDS